MNQLKSNFISPLHQLFRPSLLIYLFENNEKKQDYLKPETCAKMYINIKKKQEKK